MTRVLFIILISTLVVLLLMTIFKTVFFRKKNFLDYFYLCGTILLYVLLIVFFKKQELIWNIIISAFTIFLNIRLIMQIFRMQEINNLIIKKSNTLIKNAPFDYYYATNEEDVIVDYSDSFLELTKLTREELLNSLGIQTLIATLNITTINGDKINETKAIRFDYEYKTTQTNNVSRFFEIGLYIGGEETTLSVIVEPMYLRNKFIGRNVYLSENNKETLNKLEQGLLQARDMILADRTQLYCAMSMIKNVIMFYDYNASKYLLTEAFCKAYNITKREININDFYTLIHPQDRLYYQEQSEVITSIEVTRLKYRIKIGKDYVKINDDAMYLNKDSGLLSIISYDNEEVIIEEKPVEKESKNVDYKVVLNDTLKVLEKLVDE